MEHSESLTTKEYGELTRVEPESIRRAYCVHGHYLGVKPLKLPNGRLLWPKAEALRVLGAGMAERR